MTLFTASEAAKKLNVNPITIIRLFDAGLLPGIVLRAGAQRRMIRFRPETLEKYLATREKVGSR